MGVAEAIKQIIYEDGLKQNAVAKRTSFSESQFNALLNGRKTFLADYLPEICVAIGHDPSEVYERSN